jgi:hypothetical protein
MEALMHTIMLWLSLTFALPSADEVPHIRHVPPQRLAALHFGAAVGQGREQGILGAYDARSRTIFLREDWNSRNVADVSVLVHEVVHYLQDRASGAYECAAAREAVAYEAQHLWLQMFGRTLEEAFGIDKLTLKLRTSCLPY